MVNEKQLKVYGGIDTHADTHHIVVIDAAGQRLADVEVPTTAAGYQAALRFLRTWPALVSVGIECTGSYGASVTRVVREAGIEGSKSTGPTGSIAGSGARLASSCLLGRRSCSFGARNGCTERW